MSRSPASRGAARVLARAFYEDPVVKYAWPDDATRAARAERSFLAQLKALRNHRVVDVDASFSSVAVSARPDAWKVPAASQLRVLPGIVASRARIRGLVAIAKAEALHPAEPHWYLEYLGTDPERQGRGLGGQALAPVLARADADGVAVWGWSSNPQNIGFYHRHGFVVLDEIPLAKDGPTIFPIRREPVAPR